MHPTKLSADAAGARRPRTDMKSALWLRGGSFQPGLAGGRHTELNHKLILFDFSLPPPLPPSVSGAAFLPHALPLKGREGWRDFTEGRALSSSCQLRGLHNPPPNTLPISVWLRPPRPLGFAGGASQEPSAPDPPFELSAERSFHVRPRRATPLICVTSHGWPY